MLRYLDAATVAEGIRLAAATYPEPESEETHFMSAAELVDAGIEKSAEQKALDAFLGGLDADQMAELVALAWLGRADAGETPEDFEGLVSTARVQNHGPEYLASKFPLPKYLRAGLALLQGER
jgi:hypothetical protein